MPDPALPRLSAPLAALLLSTLTLIGLATPAQARDGQVLLRAEIGKADSNFDEGASDRTHALRAGYYFNPHFAVEGFYAKLYEGSVPNGAMFSRSEGEFDALGIGAVGKKRFGEERGFFLQARGGVARYEGRITTVIDIPCGAPLPCISTFRNKDSADGLYYGVGAGYDFNDNVGVGLNYDVHAPDFDGIDLETRALTASLEIRF